MQQKPTANGGHTINFACEDIPYSLSHWITEAGELRFHTDEQLLQTNAARDISLFISQLSSLLSRLEEVSGEPADSSHQTLNDSYIRMLKRDAESLKSSWSGSVPEGGYESALHRLYDNFKKCPDITLSELRELGTKKREIKTTILAGAVTPERIAESIESMRKGAKNKK